MRFFECLLLSILCLPPAISLQASSASGLAQSWNDFEAKREALKSFHQEFEISRTFKVAQHEQASKSSAILDGSGGRWRERFVSGSGGRVQVFDGADSFQFEEGGDEYVRLKRSSKEEAPQPDPYTAVAHLDFSKAVERDRHPCALNNLPHECVTIDIPIKPYMRGGGTSPNKVLAGVARFSFDTATGLLIYARTVLNVDNGKGGYQSDVVYQLKRMSYNSDANDSLFHFPAGAKAVKELSRWNAGKIKKQLAGKTAPDLSLTDIQGKTIKLGELKGKTVLLDFWTTWCGPCRADGPSLDKLQQKYGAGNLAIIGISVDEERPVVQKFLSEHAHQYPIALTSENEMPDAYQIGVFPTYIVIDTDGNLADVTEGEKGFADLRRMLKKAGLDTD